jgi:hypothetical protein
VYGESGPAGHGSPLPTRPVNGPRQFLRVTPCAVVLVLACAAHPTAPQALRFSVADGRVLNEFYRHGPVAAHLVLTSGETPRIVFAFPAGNSGTAVWFAARSDAFAWTPEVTITSSRRALPDGAAMHGVTAELIATGGSVTVQEAILSSVRVIRDREDADQTTAEVLVEPQVSERAVTWERRRLDGAAGYALSIDVQRGTLTRNDAGAIILSPAEDGRLRLRVTALTGDTPLTPVAGETLFTSSAKQDERLRDILTFLTYEEKLLAGSWRFNTYFGRDTLMSVRLLAPVLQPHVIEAGLGAVLERLDEHGEVAHEEDIGEFAVLRRRRDGEAARSEPIFDYKMIDDDFMLPVVAAHYLLDTPDGRERAPAFLARKADSGETYGARLVSNLRFVLGATRSFAREPNWRHLVGLKSGESVGNWRDSNDGLGGGRYAYDVNGVFAPAALAGIARLHASGMLRSYLGSRDDELFSQAGRMAAVWRREAPRLFDVSVPSARARAEVEAYARRTGVEAAPALRALGNDDVRFRAVALDAHGHAIPIVNSDEGFALLFLDGDPAETARVAESLTRPFPAGLLTEVGLVVADPAYASDEIEPKFDRNRYHGTVIWSWQQEVLAAGIERQLTRNDLTVPARESLLRARARLQAAMSASDAVRGSELWSWSQENGRFRLEPFGQRRGDETESNAAQLWSTVHLARPRN